MSHYTDKTHIFRDEDDNRTVVVTTQFDRGFEAELIETTGGALELLNLLGHGSTRLEAIADLYKKMEQEQ